MATGGSRTLQIFLLMLSACASEGGDQPAGASTDERIEPRDPPTAVAVGRGPWLQSAVRAGLALYLANERFQVSLPGRTTVRADVYVGEQDQLIQFELGASKFDGAIDDPREARDDLAVGVVLNLWEVIGGTMLTTAEGVRVEPHSDSASWDSLRVELTVRLEWFQLPHGGRQRWRARFRWRDLRRSVENLRAGANPYQGIGAAVDRFVWVDAGEDHDENPTNPNEVPFSLAD